MKFASLSFGRLIGVMIKEFIQMRRDRMTFGMIVGIPVVQLIMFGFAINADPKNLPIAIVSADNSVYSRSFIRALENTKYFTVVDVADTETEANRLLELGDVQFVVTIPVDFERKLVRGERPALLIEADATDPSATGNAIAALQALPKLAFQRDLVGPLQHLAAMPDPIDLRVHRRYNPEGLSRYNIVPGLIGTILTMTMVMMTAFAITRERERGTMENLLATPVRPIEVMIGKIAPYIIVGYIQVCVILLAAKLLFAVPMVGSLVLLSSVLLLFIAANLALGFTFSTIAKNQLQAMQMSFFFLLPSILLSGFMFPFRGMPGWAQAVGEVLPVTHFLRVIRGILLKGNGFLEIWPHLWPIALFMLVVAAIALRRYRETLD
ncbi:MAG: ABC transporter permease [Usitatibacteraceae bacterium]